MGRQGYIHISVWKSLENGHLEHQEWDMDRMEIVYED
jgi:hypothetical protein